VVAILRTKTKPVHSVSKQNIMAFLFIKQKLFPTREADKLSGKHSLNTKRPPYTNVQ
jgi:hypothetical protein